MNTVPVPSHDRLLALEAENAELRSRLRAIEERDCELMKANDVLKRSLTTLTTANSLQSFLRSVLQQAIHAMGAVSGAVFVYNPSSHTLDLAEMVLWGEILEVQTDPRTEIWRKVPADLSPLWEEMSQNEKIFWFDIEDAPPEHWTFADTWHRRLGHRMLAAIPLKVADQPLGHLGLAFAGLQQPTEIKLEQCTALVHHIALALQISRLSEEAQQVAVARAQEKAAQERAAELITINEALTQRSQEVQRSYRLLSVVAQVAQELLENPNMEQAITQGLQKLGEATGASRMTLFQETPEPHTGRLQHHIILEWTVSNVPRLINNPDTRSLYSDDYPDIAADLHAGRPANLHLRDYPSPAPAFWAKFGVHSRSIVPILIEGNYFGCVCFDDCFQYHPWSEQEMDILTAGAGAIGAALLRQRLAERLMQAAIAREQERTAQERVIELAIINESLTQRDRLLSVVAQVTQNLLENPNVEQAIAQALHKLGDAAGANRVNLLEQQEICPGQLQHRVLMEWTTPHTPRQIDDPATQVVMNNDIALVFAKLHAGHPVCLSLEDYPESIRPALASIDIQVSGIAPIFIGREYFGCLCFDNCVNNRLWSEQEMDVLMTGAGAIGAALLRQRLVERLIRSQAEQERVAELAKTNDALKRSLNTIATDANPHQIIAHILKIVAEQFETPLVEYWIHSENCHTAHLKLTQWRGNTLNPSEQPGHPGNHNFPCFPCLLWDQTLDYPCYCLIKDVTTDPTIRQVSEQIGIDVVAWFTARGVQQLLNIPLRLNEKTIGSLDIWLPGDRHFSPSQIELAYTFGQQLTLASYLNQLFEEAKQTVLFEERNRIAGDIHDTLAQAFTGISLQLEVAKPLIYQEPDTVENILQHVSQLTKNGLDEARRSVWALYPPGTEYANLAQMLYNSVEQMSRNTSISLEVNIIGDPCPLSPYLGMNLLRIGQEALTNALKHSQAQTVLIELTYTADLVSLSICDDGRGFTPPTNPDNLNGGFGLVGMYERCDRISALLSILSQPGQGTKILVESPLI
ncbi:GAF domain-containing protein [Oscillatoria sp. FACHB-1407]|uniref:GAF domain-containing sensor histidine kinase n=1 Tax=Oscillatoria sp. FACHB-1407 TaxID=2692847 RepID=UPI0016840F3D|nr:GAF domain-containing protein [Oscillatoria sp. FACHB-1407]MBD2463083.1 GAF domain-containing protein [Oscillatoria sp. FACHB-1407]